MLQAQDMNAEMQLQKDMMDHIGDQVSPRGREGEGGDACLYA